MEGGEAPSVADYFVVAGLDDNVTLLQPPEYGEVGPIVELQIVLPLENELCPEGWEYITPSHALYPANLNWVNPAQMPVYLICRRGYDRKPIYDIDVQFIERKDRAKPGYEYIKTSIGGKPVSLNGHVSRPNKHVYLGYARSVTNSFTDGVTTIHQTSSKRDDSRQGFKSIRLHKSTFSGDTFISYKLSKFYAVTGIFKESLLDRYPKADNPSFPLDEKNSPAFCLPMGVQVEWFRNRDVKPTPQFSSFVLTNEKGNKMYGSSLTFYELFIGTEKIQALSDNYPKDPDLFPYATKSICILSRWPSFFETFQKWLTELYEISVSGLALTIPIERLISNMLYDVPFPTLTKPTVSLTIGDKTIPFEQPLTTQIPTSGGTVKTLLECLEPNHLLQVFFQLLLEENVLFISSSSLNLTATAEAFCSLLYPFKWMSPYIPLLPRLIGEELFADFELDCPVPFIIGMKRDFLEMYHCPDRVTQVDLDHNTVRLPSSHMNPSDYLPKQVVNNLRNSLTSIYNMCDTNSNVRTRAVELQVQETFLRFQATLLRGYTDYLLPVLESKDKNFCNAENLFNIGKFIASREEIQRPFYKKLLSTQMFNCFIISRSFISDSDETLEFFDGCIERLEDNTALLHETDSNRGVTVVVQTEKMSQGLKPSKLYSYPVFVLDRELFYTNVPEERGGQERSVISLRTKVEKQKMVKRAHAAKMRSNTLAWSKCLLQHVYCVWYLYLPSLITILEPGEEQHAQLNTALQIIQALRTDRKTNLEEVCYRILISLSGFYDHPQVAMDTFTHMQEIKMNISAVTYGHYHRAVLFNENVNGVESHAISHWKTLRLYIITCIAFKRFRRRAEVPVINTSSLESIQSSEKNNDSPTGTGRFSSNGMSDSGIELDHPLSALKVSLDKRTSNHVNDTNTASSPPNPNTSQKPPSAPLKASRRGHTRSISDVSMLSVGNVHQRQLSDDAGYKTLSRLKSPRFKRNSLMGKTVQDKRGVSRSNTNSFKRAKSTMTPSSSTYSVQSLEPEDDPGDFYNREFENPNPMKFTLTPACGEDLDPDAELKVKIWSSYSCSHCQRMIYDEQILAGWGHEESNLSTTCPYCDMKSVAQLSIEVTYRSVNSESEPVTPRMHRESSISKTQPIDTNNIQISLEGEDDTMDSYESGNINFAMPEPIRRERKSRSGSVLASMNPRTMSMKKKKEEDNTVERIEVPYLCPIVLRKEVECVCESDGPGEMVKDDLATSHTIVFWNMVWWFCRENLSSSLPLYIPQAFRHLHPKGQLCQSVELSTQWCKTSHSLYNNFEELSHHKDLPQCTQLWRVVENFMQDDLQSAVNLLVVHRTEAHINLYRELVYLGCRYKNNFSNLQFDEDYTSCLARIPQISSSRLRPDDVPMKQSDIHCRQMFSWLGLSI
ncbi:hypothetical protein ACHWQZ_G011222 [Mnemiopsis leidyi]